jgi:hypothetical protein
MTDRVNRFVQVEMKHQALREPQFIVESHGVYYLTLALWAYDPTAEGLTSRQQQDVQEIKATFDRLMKEGRGRQAVELPDIMPMDYSYTNPG